MASIYLLSAEGTQTEYEENQLRALWQEGQLKADAYCWKEGMQEWTPLPFYFSSIPQAPAHFAPPPAQNTLSSGRRRYGFKKDPRALTFFLLIMLTISLILEGLLAIGHFQLYHLLGGESFTKEQTEAHQAGQAMLSIGYLVVYIITAITFLKWIYRANLNCHCFGTRDMKFSPGWSIGWYFIPFMNLFKPYQAMKEIWLVSKDPQKWQSQKGSLLLGIWWALWIVSNILGQAAGRLTMGADTPEDLKLSAMVSIASSCISIPLCLIAALLIQTIINQQRKLTER